MSARRIAIITGTRAEFGLLEPALRAIEKRRRLQPQLVVTGMHLLPRFGRTIDYVRAAGWPVAAAVRMQSGRDDLRDQPQALARGVAGMAKALDRLRSDVVVVLGDRIEAFAGACAAAMGRRVLAHIHGGDRAVGDVDDSLRNAITRLAHVHLVASADAAKRLRRMGEQAGRIHQVGAPGIDDIADLKRVGPMPRLLDKLLGTLVRQPYAVVVQHPIGRARRQEAEVTRRILRSIEAAGLAGVIIYPNSDPGHEGIIQTVERWQGRPGWRCFRSLPRALYLLVVLRAAVLIGNSSSGIIESASLGINAVNVGRRQEGRLRCGPNVVDCGESTSDIHKALRAALRRPRPRGSRSVYGDGRAGERIARVLDRLRITPQLLRKGLAY